MARKRRRVDSRTTESDRLARLPTLEERVAAKQGVTYEEDLDASMDTYLTADELIVEYGQYGLTKNMIYRGGVKKRTKSGYKNTYNLYEVLNEIQMPMSYEEMGSWLDTDTEGVKDFVRDFEVKTQTVGGVKMLNAESLTGVIESVGAPSLEGFADVVQSGVRSYSELGGPVTLPALTTSAFRDQYGVSQSEWGELTKAGGLLYNPTVSRGQKWITEEMQVAYTDQFYAEQKARGHILGRSEFAEYVQGEYDLSEKQYNKFFAEHYDQINVGRNQYDTTELDTLVSDFAATPEGVTVSNAAAFKEAVLAIDPNLGVDYTRFQSEYKGEYYRGRGQYDVSGLEAMIAEFNDTLDAEEAAGYVAPEGVQDVEAFWNTGQTMGLAEAAEFMGVTTTQLREDQIAKPTYPYGSDTVRYVVEMNEATRKYMADAVIAAEYADANIISNATAFKEHVIETYDEVTQQNYSLFRNEFYDTYHTGRGEYDTSGLGTMVENFGAIVEDWSNWGSATEVGESMFPATITGGVSTSKITKALRRGVFGDPNDPDNPYVRRTASGQTEYKIDALLGLYDPWTHEFYSPGEDLPTGWTTAQITDAMETAGYDEDAQKGMLKSLETAEKAGMAFKRKDQFGDTRWDIHDPNFRFPFPQDLWDVMQGGTAQPGLMRPGQVVPDEPTSFQQWQMDNLLAEAGASDADTGVRVALPPADTDLSGIEPEGDRGRTVFEVMRYLMADPDEGGMGLTQAKATNLIAPFLGEAEDRDGVDFFSRDFWVSQEMGDWEAPISDQAFQTVTVERVIDADTVELTTGEKVRLMGYDAPEVGEAGFTEATNVTKEFFARHGNEIDVSVFGPPDKYGRLLLQLESEVGGMDLKEWYRYNYDPSMATRTPESDQVVVDALFKRYASAVKDYRPDDIGAARSELEGMGLSAEEWHSRGMAAPGEEGTEDHRNLDAFEHIYKVHNLVDEYEQYRDGGSIVEEQKTQAAADELAAMGYDDPDAMVGIKQRDYAGAFGGTFDRWMPYLGDMTSVWRDVQESLGIEKVVTPSEEYGLQYGTIDDPTRYIDSQAGTGKDLYVDETTNWNAYVVAVAGDNEFEYGRILDAWGDLGIHGRTQAAQRATDDQLESAVQHIKDTDTSSGTSWSIRNVAHDRRVPGGYIPLPHSFIIPGLPSIAGTERIREDDIEWVEEIVNKGWRAAAVTSGIWAGGLIWRKLTPTPVKKGVYSIGSVVARTKWRIWNAAKRASGVGASSMSEADQAVEAGNWFEKVAGKVRAGEELTGDELKGLRVAYNEPYVRNLYDDAMEIVADRETAASLARMQGVELTENLVASQRFERIAESVASEEILSESDLAFMRRVGGDPDLMQYIQDTSGVNVTGILQTANEGQVVDMVTGEVMDVNALGRIPGVLPEGLAAGAAQTISAGIDDFGTASKQAWESMGFTGLIDPQVEGEFRKIADFAELNPGKEIPKYMSDKLQETVSQYERYGPSPQLGLDQVFPAAEELSPKARSLVDDLRSFGVLGEEGGKLSDAFIDQTVDLIAQSDLGPDDLYAIGLAHGWSPEDYAKIAERTEGVIKGATFARTGESAEYMLNYGRDLEAIRSGEKVIDDFMHLGAISEEGIDVLDLMVNTESLTGEYNLAGVDPTTGLDMPLSAADEIVDVGRMSYGGIEQKIEAGQMITVEEYDFLKPGGTRGREYTERAIREGLVDLDSVRIATEADKLRVVNTVSDMQKAGRLADDATEFVVEAISKGRLDDFGKFLRKGGKILGGILTIGLLVPDLTDAATLPFESREEIVGEFGAAQETLEETGVAPAGWVGVRRVEGEGVLNWVAGMVGFADQIKVTGDYVAIPVDQATPDEFEAYQVYLDEHSGAVGFGTPQYGEFKKATGLDFLTTAGGEIMAPDGTIVEQTSFLDPDAPDITLRQDLPDYEGAGFLTEPPDTGLMGAEIERPVIGDPEGLPVELPIYDAGDLVVEGQKLSDLLEGIGDGTIEPVGVTIPAEPYTEGYAYDYGYDGIELPGIGIEQPREVTLPEDVGVRYKHKPAGYEEPVAVDTDPISEMTKYKQPMPIAERMEQPAHRVSPLKPTPVKIHEEEDAAVAALERGLIELPTRVYPLPDLTPRVYPLAEIAESTVRKTARDVQAEIKTQEAEGLLKYLHPEAYGTYKGTSKKFTISFTDWFNK